MHIVCFSKSRAIRCIVLGKSARIKISCKLGCFYRYRIGVAGHSCFNRGLLTRCQYLFRMLLVDCVVLSNGTKKRRMMECCCCCFLPIKSCFKNNDFNSELIFMELVASVQKLISEFL